MDNYLILIDADEILYTAAHSSQKVSYDILIECVEEPIINFKYSKEARQFVDWNPDKGYQIVKRIDPEESWIARYNTDTLIKGILESCKTKDYSLYLSGKDNFRYKIATLTPYKGTRPEEKPAHYQLIKDYLIEEHFAIVADYQEADDALGIMSSSYTKEDKWTPIIASQDKDLRMIPGYWYDKKENVIKFISEIDSHKSFFRQLLTGDSTDNIPGIHGMGPVTAHKLVDSLENPLEMYKVCFKTWEEAIQNKKFKYETEKSVEEIILEIGQLLWIRRYPDQMWSPEIY